ncbi:PTS lactose/cellobiose transporter subunit IIA [Bacillus sp. Marseille-P3800]|uniref:PTS lactose/cellobiose transporter subunit IIA n=1 Tax=Bacillus sp. Marseille-P3800 TaxID=2014782 RepID=UPI000C06BD20|nr:PTS lactose/cellobiose transporter subunit IIA [Bacillus sp. Marseille-P3800]
MTKTLEEISFTLILHSGNARSFAMEAIQAAKKGAFEQAAEKLKEADAAFVTAHHGQTELLQQEAQGNGVTPSILLIHAQDHLMTSMTVKEMAVEMVELYQRLPKGV